MKFISKIELLLVGLWLGAACFFSFAVAPSVFSILESRELAGGIVNRNLTILNFSGIAIGIILLSVSFVPRGESKRIWAWLQRFFLLILTLACAAGQFIIGLWLDHIRSLMGNRPIDELAADDPLKIQFAAWHQYSVWVLIVAMIAALLAFFIISRSYTSSPKATDSPDIPDFDLPDELKM